MHHPVTLILVFLIVVWFKKLFDKGHGTRTHGANCATWMNWRSTAGVFCDGRINEHVKSKIYHIVVSTLWFYVLDDYKRQ